MMIAFSCAIEKLTSRLYGVGPRVKEADLATDIKVMNICGSSLDRQPDLSCMSLCEQFYNARRVHQEIPFPSLYLAQGQI